ncbi:SulP family inorganic anion transporter [Dysgonomonas macrotermitis]|uniref:Sulfate permease, SulP family n=1 Tax=Dysgonomonas macrotermitis TaxID=1346286 RepID=A0A1M5CZ48_9BACT|nr:sulfate permease [Dysgonomonas macrotermitis]SHF59914.1 sulfate permease, SulP family [Dysgonomonas macrotermitis]
MLTKAANKAETLFKSFRPQILDSLKGYNKDKFMADLMAGLIVGIVALPLAIAFGIASGVSPEKGLYTAIIAGFIISALGGSTVQIGGPTGAFIVVVYNIIEQFGFEGLVITTIMSGIMLILMGVLKLGVVIKYIPYPVIVGYMSGIAVTIFSTQIKDFFGLQVTNTPPDFLGKWHIYIANFSTLDLVTVGIGILSLIIIIFSHKISKKIPGSLIAVVFVTILAYCLRHFLGIDSVETIGDRFIFKSTLPDIEGVSFNIRTINILFPYAFTLAILGSIESLISANVADGVTGAKNNSNMELIAQGVANIITPLFGGIPATGALARTMTNVSNGGRTPVAGIIHAAFLLLVVLFLGNLTKHIPMVCLAAILVVVSYNMSEWRSFLALLRNSKADVVVLVTTFLLTVIFDLTIAIEIGLLLAVFLFLKRIMDVTEVSVITNELNPTDNENTPDEEKLTIPKEVEVYEIDGPFFFGIANKFEESMHIIGDQPMVRIIRMRKVPFIDSTGLHNLESLCKKSQSEHIRMILSGVRPNVHDALDKFGFSDLIGEENICPNITVALEKATAIVKHSKAKAD